jgi:hypothetical protein
MEFEKTEEEAVVAHFKIMSQCSSRGTEENHEVSQSR